MANYRAKVPPYAERYFMSFGHGMPMHPVITQAFDPRRGWQQYPIRKRVSATWLRKMRQDGFTAVRLVMESHASDFSISELLNRR